MARYTRGPASARQPHEQLHQMAHSHVSLLIRTCVSGLRQTRVWCCTAWCCTASPQVTQEKTEVGMSSATVMVIDLPHKIISASLTLHSVTAVLGWTQDGVSHASGSVATQGAAGAWFGSPAVHCQCYACAELLILCSAPAVVRGNLAACQWFPQLTSPTAHLLQAAY